MKVIDNINKWMGGFLIWFMLGLIALVVLDITMRFVFNNPTMWTHEIALMVACSMYILSWGDIQRRNDHIRIDVFFNKLSPRGKAIVDLICTLLFFMPLMIAMAYVSFTYAVEAWEINEKSTETIWYPPLAPLRTVVFVGVCLLILQFVVHLVQCIPIVFKSKTKPIPEAL